jgi:lysophospholipase
MSEGSVLLIHTGGTIGMRATERGYEPTRGYLAERMAQIRVFNDPEAEGDRLTSPSRFGRRVRYEILELEPLLDSANMTTRDWVRIAETIAAHEHDYDAFVVMHGTDTMAYTASALSFMLEGLDKTVVLTGSQIPLSRTRNDAVDNLLGALLFAGEYALPEVGIYFSDKLLRGNRARKVDASGFDAFRSGNFPPLVRVGVEVDVRWDLVRPPAPGGLRVVPITNELVAALRLFPSLSADILERFLAAPLEGLILETYGAGNAPDNRPRLLSVLAEASARGVVIVNCTQCQSGMVTSDYSTGRALLDAGVIAGADLTPEAALTKLQWLLSQGLDTDVVRDRMTRSLRGELTAPNARPRFRWDG